MESNQADITRNTVAVYYGEENINTQTFANMPIELPDRETQDRIVDILSAIDDKIKLNNRINHNLAAKLHS